MKMLQFFAIGALFILTSFRSEAQEERIIPVNQPNYNKPQIFADLPSKIPLNPTTVEPLFISPVGNSVTVRFTKDFYLQGKIVSRATDTLVQSVVIRAVNRKGAVFTLTKVRSQNGGLILKGRIISRDSNDAFEIVKEGDQYFLQKKNYYELIAE